LYSETPLKSYICFSLYRSILFYLVQNSHLLMASNLFSEKVWSPKKQSTSMFLLTSRNSTVGIPVFGPTPLAARLEGSKAFAKLFMARHSVPTASYANFSSYEKATAYVSSLPISHKIVIKASGLAAGKGVILPTTRAEALESLKHIMQDKEFGAAGDEVVVEEFLEGYELSVLAFCDGYTAVALPCAQDHKRIGEGDTGPNTGGMGTYAPAPAASPKLIERIRKEVLERTLEGCRKDGFPFVGLLFVGLMIGEGEEPKVLEYNVRFGDPETQTLVKLLDNETDLGEILLVKSFCPRARCDYRETLLIYSTL
jgi:phosphoribosylamine--glycine ligase/phosphoribosylformylglycinamidine cyclo-ligase